MIIAFAAGFLVGCTPSGTILEDYGRIHSRGANWTVELSPTEPGLKVINRRAGDNPGARELRKVAGMRITESPVSPSDWTNHPGAFVFFDEDDRVWAWNGKDRTFIYE